MHSRPAAPSRVSPIWRRTRARARWRCCWCTEPTRRIRSPPRSPGRSPRPDSKSASRPISTRPRPRPTSCSPISTRSSSGTTPSPATACTRCSSRRCSPCSRTRSTPATCSCGWRGGRGANKPWLQELPDPVSKITWHGWVEVHPETAAKWQVANGDVLLLKSPHGALRAPVWITPGVRPDVLAIPTGQGHKAYGRYARDRSFNAFELLSDAPTGYGGRALALSVAGTKTRDHPPPATPEGGAREQGGGGVAVLPLPPSPQLKRGAHPFQERLTPPYADRALAEWAEAQHEEAAQGDYAHAHPRWGMAIDLAKCTGCSACVTACYAENNLATVGEELVVRRRQMSWLRIERYYTGGEAGRPVGAVVTPMLCQQCGNAPCEPVCPVYAAYHTADGLNGQVYNRCVGTRYCANNCPYKVRYFNWYNYAEPGGEWESWPDPLNMLLNPDVTVREKGVMEKCTFCVQRIRGAQNRARLEDRNVQDGDITPSCAQACPSEAIVFGDLHDRTSRVAALAQDPRGYHVHTELNTKPAITYLARVVHGAAGGAGPEGPGGGRARRPGARGPSTSPP